MRKFNTVFNKINPEGMHPNEILAIVFHRTTAILYFMYAVWGIAAVWVNLSTEFPREAVHDFGDFFQMLVPFVALAACAGATFFPRLGRLELLAESSLATLVAVFLVIAAINAIHHPEAPRLWPNLILNSTPLVLMIMRAGYIFRTLVWEAVLKQRRRSK